MIFIHSGFRTASTYLWSCLRKSERTITYYEVFNEELVDIKQAALAISAPELWYSKHPRGAPYFLEYLQLIRPNGGVDGFDPSISYQRFVPPDGCGGAISNLEAAYVAKLVKSAEERGRIPVLTATRSLGRLRGLKVAAPGLHVLLYRNVFHQWCSFTEQAFLGNAYFLNRTFEAASLSEHDPVIRNLREFFPVETPSIYDANTFYRFLFFHLHLYTQSAGGADMIVDMHRLESDPQHRAEVEQRFRGQDVVVDLSGARNTIAFSLCRLGSTEDVAERMKVVGNLVIDRAPDAAGRAFGSKVLSELMEEHARHAFHVGALRTVFDGPKGPVAERDAARELLRHHVEAGESLRAEFDQVSMEHAAAVSQRDSVRAERDAAATERDTAQNLLHHHVEAGGVLRAEFDQVSTEHAAALSQLDSVRAERDGAVTERDTARDHLHRQIEANEIIRAEFDRSATDHAAAVAQHDSIRADRDAALTQRDAALEQVRYHAELQAVSRASNQQLTDDIAAVRSDRDARRGERDAALVARDKSAAQAREAAEFCMTLREERDRLAAMHKQLQAERDALHVERDDWLEERDMLHAERAALQAHGETVRVARDKAAEQARQQTALAATLRVERDRLVADHVRLQSELSALMAERTSIAETRDDAIEHLRRHVKARRALEDERDRLADTLAHTQASESALHVERDALRAEREGLNVERDSLRAERDANAAARDTGLDRLREQSGAVEALQSQLDRQTDAAARVIAERDAILRSVSWRLTSPLRIVARYKAARRARRVEDGLD